jgi:hypothetical protein
MPQLSGITYGRAKNEKGKALESKDTVINDGVFEAYGMRNVAPKFETSRSMYKLDFGIKPSGLGGSILATN